MTYISDFENTPEGKKALRQEMLIVSVTELLICKVMQKQGINYKQLAAKIGESERIVDEILHGEFGKRFKIVMDILDALGIKPIIAIEALRDEDLFEVYDGIKEMIETRNVVRRCESDDGQTITYYNIHGKRHRIDGPAVEEPLAKYWYKNGDRHREDGPAIERADGTKEWYKNGKRFFPIE